MYDKYVKVLAVKLKNVFTTMSDVNIIGVKLNRDEGDQSEFPLAQMVSYERKDETTTKGQFALGFSDKAMATQVASAIAEKVGMGKLESFDQTVVDVLGEFMNTVVGHTISEWDRLGMPVIFSPPSQLKKMSFENDPDYVAQSYTIILNLAFDKISFRVTFLDKRGLEADKRKILVVDDSLVIRHMLSNNLNEQGYEVAEAVNGIEAIKAYKSFKPELTIMDLIMPEMGGFDAIMAIRQINPDAAFIMLTSSARKDEVITAKTLNVFGYLIKPSPKEVIIKTVEKVLKRLDAK